MRNVPPGLGCCAQPRPGQSSSITTRRYTTSCRIFIGTSCVGKVLVLAEERGQHQAASRVLKGAMRGSQTLQLLGLGICNASTATSPTDTPHGSTSSDCPPGTRSYPLP